jgi:hypothetical protein
MFTMAMKDARPSQVFGLQRQLATRLVSMAGELCDEFGWDWLKVRFAGVHFIEIGNAGQAGFRHALGKLET